MDLSFYKYTPQNILAQVDGLTRDKLTYFVPAGYVSPERVTRGTLRYAVHSERDLWILRRAWPYIHEQDMRTRAAFERAEKDYTQLELEFEAKKSSVNA